MDSMNFDYKPVTKIPGRRYIKKSKYDPIIDRFVKSKDEIWQVNIEGVESNYLRTQISKRLKIRELESKIEASVVNDMLYLQKK